MGNATIAQEFGKLCGRALRNGVKSPEWEAVAKEYAEDEDDLKKLMFQDELFNQEEWAEVAVGYVIGGGVCTVSSARDGGTRRGMTEDIERILG
ncbi:MAG: hypothetical protein IPJ30_04630 [Acidobacteria bacterium]|nr:hypothetical protein [Acidobacteriota bacterium]